jgi:ceramide glucosyltransferase
MDRLDMNWYYAIAWMAILAQLLFVYQAVRNYSYARAKYERNRRPAPPPRVALLIPCKGLDARFGANIASLLKQDYEPFCVFFVVAEQTDPAYAELGKIKETLGKDSKALDIQILVAGPPASCSQKIHNLLYAIDRLPADTEVLAFADSDVCVHDDWLSRLVWPLRRPGRGAASGYRWFVPARNNLATLALSAINASVAQLLGNSRLNHAWGGSMAIHAQDFRRLGLRQVWQNTLSDDFSLSRAVKSAGMRVTFVPGCLVPSFESTTWPGLYEFARRQLLITRVYVPRTWWAGLLASLGSVAGFWGGLILAGWAAAVHSQHIILYAAVPTVFFAGQLIRALLRQLAAVTILSEYAPQLWWAAIADIAAGWVWSPLLLLLILSSAFGRTIRWRGIRYRLVSPSQTEVLSE